MNEFPSLCFGFCPIISKRTPCRYFLQIIYYVFLLLPSECDTSLSEPRHYFLVQLPQATDVIHSWSLTQSSDLENSSIHALFTIFLLWDKFLHLFNPLYCMSVGRTVWQNSQSLFTDTYCCINVSVKFSTAVWTCPLSLRQFEGFFLSATFWTRLWRWIPSTNLYKLTIILLWLVFNHIQECSPWTFLNWCGKIMILQHTFNVQGFKNKNSVFPNQFCR